MSAACRRFRNKHRGSCWRCVVFRWQTFPDKTSFFRGRYHLAGRAFGSTVGWIALFGYRLTKPALFRRATENVFSNSYFSFFKFHSLNDYIFKLSIGKFTPSLQINNPYVEHEATFDPVAICFLPCESIRSTELAACANVSKLFPLYPCDKNSTEDCSPGDKKSPDFWGGVDSGDSFSHSFMRAFFVLGNLNSGASWPTAAATR